MKVLPDPESSAGQIALIDERRGALQDRFWGCIDEFQEKPI